MNEYLLYLAGVGAIAVAAFLTSEIAEKFAFWHKLDPMVKLLIQLVLSTIIGVGATFLVKNPQLWTGMEDYLMVVINLIVALVVNQGTYTQIKRNENREE